MSVTKEWTFWMLAFVLPFVLWVLTTVTSYHLPVILGTCLQKQQQLTCSSSSCSSYSLYKRHQCWNIRPPGKLCACVCVWMCWCVCVCTYKSICIHMYVLLACKRIQSHNAETDRTLLNIQTIAAMLPTETNRIHFSHELSCHRWINIKLTKTRQFMKHIHM